MSVVPLALDTIRDPEALIARNSQAFGDVTEVSDPLNGRYKTPPVLWTLTSAPPNVPSTDAM